jgi:hypothetical protein
MPYPLDFSGTAIEGYDVVSDLTEGFPKLGSKQHTSTRAEPPGDSKRPDSFAAVPEHYAPQSGGYGARAVARGAAAGIDPAAWKVVDGNLTSNLNRAIQKRWLAENPGCIAKADAIWPRRSAFSPANRAVQRSGASERDRMGPGSARF